MLGSCLFACCMCLDSAFLSKADAVSWRRPAKHTDLVTCEFVLYYIVGILLHIHSRPDGCELTRQYTPGHPNGPFAQCFFLILICEAEYGVLDSRWSAPNEGARPQR